VHKAGLPPETLGLVHLRASQINGCSFCVDAGSRQAKKSGETDERLFAVAAWREAPYFTDAERAALALTEAVTRLSDRPDPVPDEIWAEAAKHFDEKGLAALLLWIATTNVYNRVNVSVRQPAGSWG
jgi:AhpD family alkylhydroperoxidase